MGPPIPVADQPRTLARKIGTLTTSQTSRAANSAMRASDRRLIPGEFDRSPLNRASVSPDRSWRERRDDTRENDKHASGHGRQRAAESQPRQQEAADEETGALQGVFGTVRTATHLKRPESSPDGTNTLTALFAREAEDGGIPGGRVTLARLQRRKCAHVPDGNRPGHRRSGATGQGQVRKRLRSRAQAGGGVGLLRAGVLFVTRTGSEG